MLENIFGVFTGGLFIYYLVRCLVYTAVAIVVMRLMQKNYSNILVFIPIIVLLIHIPGILNYIEIVLRYILDAVDQFEIVRGFSSPAYRDYMRYLYLEPLGQALLISLHLIPLCAAPIMTYLEYKKLISAFKQDEEIRKMKIQDL